MSDLLLAPASPAPAPIGGRLGFLAPVGRQLLRALPLSVLVLGVAIVLNFALPRLAPGNPIDFLIPAEQATLVTPEQRQELAASYGLDGSTWEQFTRYIANLAHGDLGISTRHGRPVTSLLAERLPWTLLLVGTSVVLSTLIGAGLGFRSAWRRGTKSDVRTLTGIMVIDSFPPFFVALLLVLLFSVTLQLLPVFGALPAGETHGLALVAEVARRAVLPIASLTLAGLGSAYLVARSAAVAELGEDYITMAAAKGLAPAGVRRHARRNALVPVWTVAMLNVGALFGGAAPVETVFAYPGLGRLIYESVLSRDYPVLQGAFLLIAAGVIVANLVAEVVYPFLDPRVRRPGQAGS
ncbi:MAG TPA: ABC transporter permease [Acidimicrobiales bacterium]|nr:ABC transporter permease [Acidimicrobiales bacterium]